MKIIKMNYSRNPWRLVTSEGMEVYIDTPMKHPSLGETIINGPVCGATKADCQEIALSMLEHFLKRK